ncbi:hypothetical protein [Pseudomonas sp. CGJS7]|uniref:hypothetical protein n=1 Tax=Pseudomonas sp. CGJS7 TaxID=3109348 RepID=UPI00300ADA4F
MTLLLLLSPPQLKPKDQPQRNPTTVIPAKAGIHFDLALARNSKEQRQRQNGFRLSPE